MFHKLRELSKDLAIYGIGDIAVSIVNFLLLPVYVRYLSPGDYGVLGLLSGVEVVAKVVVRLGLDGSFMRFFYDCDTQHTRQRLASTLFFFLLAVNGLLLAVSLGASALLAEFLFGSERYTRALQLTLANTFVIGFTFFPFHVLRIERRAVEFGVLTLSRSIGTLLLRIVLIVGFGFGVMGVVLADVIMTAVLMVLLLRWFGPLIRPVFSIPLLRDALKFGLPRVPHAAAQQVMAAGDKVILAMYVSLAQVGIYTMGVSFGLTQKLFLSAFEYAWAPFYYANSREPDGRRILSLVTTYGFAVLCLLTAGLSAVAEDLLLTVVGSDYRSAAPVVTWTAVGVLFQGVYLLTSIGLNITKKTGFYPIATITAAGVNIALNLLLIPSFGLVGAAWANAASYAVQAGLAFVFAQAFYAIPYEWPRLVRVAAAAVIAWAIARSVPDLAPLVGLVSRGALVVGIFGGALLASGAFSTEELRLLAASRVRRAHDIPPTALVTTEPAAEIAAPGTLSGPAARADPEG